MTATTKKPEGNSAVAREMDKVEKQLDAFETQVKDLTLDRMNEAPAANKESTVRLSNNEIAHAKDVYLKPTRSIGSREKFNEDYRKDYNFQKEYVRLIAENREIIGEAIEMWTKPFAGMPAEFWTIPVGKPVWAPRYVAEQIKRARYHRLTMSEAPTSHAGEGMYYGRMIADTTIQRLDANKADAPVQVYMGASNF